jgi:hypothetical protein
MLQCRKFSRLGNLRVFTHPRPTQVTRTAVKRTVTCRANGAPQLPSSGRERSAKLPSPRVGLQLPPSAQMLSATSMPIASALESAVVTDRPAGCWHPRRLAQLPPRRARTLARRAGYQAMRWRQALPRDCHQSRCAQRIEIIPLALGNAALRPLHVRSSLRAQNGDCTRLLRRRCGAHGDEHPRFPG